MGAISVGRQRVTVLIIVSTATLSRGLYHLDQRENRKDDASTTGRKQGTSSDMNTVKEAVMVIRARRQGQQGQGRRQ